MYGLSTMCRGLGGNGEKQRPGGGPPFGFKEAWAWICPCLHLWGGGAFLAGTRAGWHPMGLFSGRSGGGLVWNALVAV